MSIIHEALKKVQSNRAENSAAENPVRSTPKVLSSTTQTFSDKIKEKNAVIANKRFSKQEIFWTILIFSLGAVTFYNLSEYTKRTAEISRTKIFVPTVTSAMVQSQTAIPSIAVPVSSSTPTPVLPKKGEIILSGIVEMDGKNFALINKEFYETGETVEGATITKISSDSIEISQKGKTRVIKILRPH